MTADNAARENEPPHLCGEKIHCPLCGVVILVRPSVEVVEFTRGRFIVEFKPLTVTHTCGGGSGLPLAA